MRSLRAPTVIRQHAAAICRRSRAGLTRAAIMLALVGEMGCAHVNASHAAAGGIAAVADLVECASEERQAVEQALRFGGAAWLDVVLELVQCVPQVVHDIQAATKTASLEEAPPASPISKGARRRMRAALALSRAVVKGGNP